MKNAKREKRLPANYDRSYSSCWKEHIGLADMFENLSIEKEWLPKSFGIDEESLLLFEAGPHVCIWMHDENKSVVYGNRLFLEKNTGCTQWVCHREIMGEEDICKCCQSAEALRCDTPQNCSLCKRKNQGYDLNVFHWPVTSNDGTRYVLKSSFHIDDTVAIEKNTLTENSSFTSEGLLTCCSACRKIRDMNRKWVRVSNYILDLFSGRISHGICPQCIRLLYPSLDIQTDEISPHSDL